MDKKFDFTKADKNGTLVEIGSNDTAFHCGAYDPRKDYAVLYPNGQFRRIIISDPDEFKSMKK